MKVNFFSDGSITKQGFSATWTYTDEEPVPVQVLKIQETTLKVNRDSILNAKLKIAKVQSFFKPSVKTPTYQTRDPATSCQEFLMLVTNRNYQMKFNHYIFIIQFYF